MTNQRAECCFQACFSVSETRKQQVSMSRTCHNHTSHINPCHREEKAFEHVQIKPDWRVHTNGLPQRDDCQSKREQKSSFYPLKMKLSLIVFWNGLFPKYYSALYSPKPHIWIKCPPHKLNIHTCVLWHDPFRLTMTSGTDNMRNLLYHVIPFKWYQDNTAAIHIHTSPNVHNDRNRWRFHFHFLLHPNSCQIEFLVFNK